MKSPANRRDFLDPRLRGDDIFLRRDDIIKFREQASLFRDKVAGLDAVEHDIVYPEFGLVVGGY